jgi:hypothetical protein
MDAIHMKRISSFPCSAVCSWSIAIVLWAFAGCSDDPGARTFNQSDDVENTEPIESHDHANPPHGGFYAVFGAEKYHGELVFDEESDQLTVYILGSDGQTPHPITEPEVTVRVEREEGDPVELSLSAAPDAGDPAGSSSRFQLADAPQNVAGAVAVTIVATIDGEEFEGQIIPEEEEHGHSHSHDHGDEGHDHEASEDDHAHSHDEETDESGDETTNP